MSIAFASLRAPRCFLINIASGEFIECLFNPTQLTEKIAVNWNRVVVPALSHQLLQFQSTGNRQLSGLEFYLDRHIARERSEDADILEFRGFLRALTVPPKGDEGVPSTAPPRALFVWPGVIAVEAVLADLEFSYRQFGVDGSVLVYTATVTFEEILDTRITSEDRREEE